MASFGYLRSGSLGSEAGQAVAAAASQVRTSSTLTAAAAHMRSCQASGGSEDGSTLSTRPSSGNSQQAQAPEPPQLATQPVALPLPRSPMRRMDWPEANPTATTSELRSTASFGSFDGTPKRWELAMPPSTTPPPRSPPRAQVAAVRVLRRAPEVSERVQMSPPPLPTLPPTAVRIPGRKGSTTQEPPESERSRASSWEASRTPPVSQTPRSEGDKEPPPGVLRHVVRTVAVAKASRSSPSDAEAGGRQAASAAR
ncbi:unnamed protein product [Symbiodinium natans]|uniref:Uncharacterized protein n=1 Tax=Symbiodinium natans TaxID=878477 RepID=A0A812P356_9DINO|nr:unnamed protein product [Symbiodinium natans]